MDIYALIGHSGTGKSHQAPLLAKQYGIKYIIDDGLLIKGNQALAGRSAKRESTRFGAIKRALFKNEEHAAQVKEKLAEIKPGKLLIIGTSRRMVDMIAENLKVEHPTYYFTIEEISSPEAIETALKVRAKTNRHVIPLPTFAIKKDFPGYLIDPLRVFFALPKTPVSEAALERSVVRPVFSTLGSFYITEHLILDLAEHIARTVKGVKKVLHVEIKEGQGRVCLSLELAIDILSLLEKPIKELLKEVQKEVKKELEYQTGFYLDRVNVCARKLSVSEAALKNKEKLRQAFR